MTQNRHTTSEFQPSTLLNTPGYVRSYGTYTHRYLQVYVFLVTA